VADAADRAAREREARTFTAALVGQVPSTYVIAQYAKAHDHLPLAPGGAFDRRMMAFAALGPWAARAADAYARTFAKSAVLRRKLVVLTAILESSAPHDAAYAPVEASPAGIVARLALVGIAFLLALLAGILVLAPLRLVTAITGERA
jgi:hypothetical protein